MLSSEFMNYKLDTTKAKTPEAALPGPRVLGLVCPLEFDHDPRRATAVRPIGGQ